MRRARPDLIVTGFRQRAAAVVAEDYALPCATVCLRRGALRGMRLDGNARHLVRLASSARFDDTPIDSRVAVSGFLFHDSHPQAPGRGPSDALLRFLGAEPFIALLPGSTPVTQATQYVRHHLDAAEALGLRLVVQRTAALEGADVDAPHAFLADTLPHDWLLARVAAVISPGRIGVVARALRAGCPILAEPRTRDDHDHARRLLALGVGAALDPHGPDATSVRRMLTERLLLPPVRERCAALAAGITMEDGSETAVDIIERRARGHYPPGN
ncbi:MAG: hypothetical protein HY943_04330 [Gammaproteobacteria bacterium]|nr:hypothetical protein [Gammaproteobacteria bacterium]